MKVLLVLLSIAIFSAPVLANKPNVWVISDICDPSDRRKGGHPKMDPDDIVSMASLLLSANKFHIENIVVASRPGTVKDPIPFMRETFVEAYEHDIKGMNKRFPGFQDTIPFTWSSITQGERGVQFNPDGDYRDISAYSSIVSLRDYAKNNEVYVLSWGPLTESAILVKHLLTHEDYRTLNNLNFISHWTKSYLSSYVKDGGKQYPFRVSNCRGDYKACTFLHDAAQAHDSVKLMELGATGQRGLVDGTKGYKNILLFENSRLGQIFLRGKAFNFTPDQSDAATHWVLSGEHGIGLEDYAWDGSLNEQQETKIRDAFLSNAEAMMDDLLARAHAANSDVFAKSMVAQHYTYVYNKNDKYGIYTPYDTAYKIYDVNDNLVQSGNVEFGANRIKLPIKEEGYYKVELFYPGNTLTFSL
ncbi:nucleoside hydrolase-like domain-containing protein [Agaribacter flavus]|uniref:Nucleoside hydrolase-like domain-containing protein n=1 Tax=Agaribacter flavus TaxID=1902781 RepID=A0ABV7FUE4_9ALTE